MLLNLQQLCWITNPLSGMCFLFGVRSCSFAGPRCDPLRLKPTDWESVFDRQRKNFADPGNASAGASPTAALLLEGRTHLLRLLQEIPLGEAEQAAVEMAWRPTKTFYRSYRMCRRLQACRPNAASTRRRGAGLVQITSVRPA
jgi:hypothetical protein